MDAPIVSITQATISSLPTSVHIRNYDRTKLKAGIVHFGVGAFHRSHQAVYLDHVLYNTLNNAASNTTSNTTDTISNTPKTTGNNTNNNNNNEWGICGVGLLPFDLPMRDAMKAQDCLYTVNEMTPEGGCTTTLIQSMVEYIYAPDDYHAVMVKLCDPLVKIVSLTITEGGYFIDNRGEFLIDNPAVVRDLANPTDPRSAIGYIVEALSRRRQMGLHAFTVMSCDNLRHNGAQAKKACLSYAAARDSSLAQWIEENVTFPNGMVDRITPATDATVREKLRKLTLVDDKAPVIAEDYIQWVLEDNFKYGRPAYETAGVLMTDNVTPYEEAKIRLLNGSHTMLSYPAFLAGKRRVDEAITDPLFAGYLRRYMSEDAKKFIPAIPGMDTDLYIDTLLRRFSNPAVGDQLARLCLDGGSKIPGFLLPTLKANLEAKGTCHTIAFLLACYNHYIHNNTDECGNTYELREPSAMAILQPIISSNSLLTLVNTPALVGDAGDYAQFVSDYLSCCEHIRKSGARHTLENLETILCK